MQVPYAAWTAGLASWRLEEYQQAADFFSLFSISLKDDAWHQTSGVFGQQGRTLNLVSMIILIFG